MTAASAPRVRALLRGIAALDSILAGFVASVAIGATPGVPSGPAITVSFTLAATFTFAWIAALWHARALFRGRSTVPAEGAA